MEVGVENHFEMEPFAAEEIAGKLFPKLELAHPLYQRFPREQVGFRLASTLLHSIAEDPERLDIVLGLQNLLILKIATCDIRTSRLQKAQKRVPRILAQPKYRQGGAAVKARSTMLKSLRKGIMARIDEIRQLAYLWRCFGDGIAAIYQSQHALRHLLYDDKYQVKQTAGAIFGKEGFGHEYATLKRGIDMGVPVVMSDLTNIIRHGDLCALAGPDPVPLELKSSRVTGGRVARQAQQLDKITTFFEKDEARNFRGSIRIIRTAMASEEINHREFLNQGIQQALQTGLWSGAPEPGLRYVCYHSAILENQELVYSEIDQWATASTWVTPLGPELSWLPAYPFTLTLTPQNSTLFMQEAFGIFVLIDLELTKQLFKDLDVHCVWLMDGTHSMQICLDPNDLMQGAYRVSQCLFDRVSKEFQSLSWFVRERSSIFEEDSKPVFTEITPEEIMTKPMDGWTGVEDFYKRQEPKA
ncbi:hypothetical protein BGP80_10360 [Pseudomonas putida]|uniref:Uncharacterized protein n=1 Tax=Pseudomonas putida TaxID=303 RepID=A0A2S3WBM2_PSEPU|nr:hypothetical protein BGP80_10360 [Pseudomonas putida]